MRFQIQECSYCSGNIVGGEFCKLCTNNYKDLPSPGVMSGEGRKEELNMLLFNPMHIPISMVFKRINILVGREVEYGEFTFNWKGLLEEAYNNSYKNI